MSLQIIPSSLIPAQYSGLGGKAEGLLLLQRAGFRVPGFFLIEPDTVRALLDNRLLPTELAAEWMHSHAIAPDTLWAVRSSAAVEDGQKNSYAGLFHTEINVRPADLPAAIQSVLEAYKAVPDLQYGAEKSFDFTVVVQEMLRPEYSGVLFSRNPVDPADPAMYVNLVPGLGAELVSGRVEAFTLRRLKGNTEYINEEGDFHGQRFTDQLETVQCSGASMRAALDPFLDALENGARKLEKLKGLPVDVEFALAGGHIYWLQVRPITTLQSKGETTVWDNANIGDNFPGLTLPLSASFVRFTYGTAYVGMSAFLGMSKAGIARNRHLLFNMADAIHGAMYYHVSAWQKLLYQMPFGRITSKLFPRLLEMEDAPFEKPAHRPGPLNYLVLFGHLIAAFVLFGRHKKAFEANYSAILDEWKTDKTQGLDHPALVRLFWDIEDRLGARWIVPVLNGFYAMILFTLLKKVLAASRLRNSHPNFINDILYAQGDVVSVQIVRSFRRLQENIRQNPALRTLFLQNDPQTLQHALPVAFPDFSAQMQVYLEQFGERCDQGELKIETVNYKEDPRLLLELLQSGATADTAHSAEPQDFDYRTVLKSAYRYAPLRRLLLQALIRAAIARVRDRENYRFMRTKGFDLVRRIFRAMDAEMLRRGHTDAPGDTLYLELETLIDPTQAPQYRSLIAAAKTRYETYKTTQRSHRYLQTADEFRPVWAVVQVNAGSHFKGLGCSSGTVEAEIVVITEENARTAQAAGRILVARYFEPGWINLFAQAAGVVSERGNLLSHTAILCREMGVPAIVGAKNIGSAVKTGSRIRMDGSSGDIFVLEETKPE